MEETMKSRRNKSALKSRREGVIKRLSFQLEAGAKSEKPAAMKTDDGIIGVYLIPLNETDKKRIQKEIDILKSRV